MFDALSYEEQLKMVQDAIADVIESETGREGDHIVLARLKNPGERLSLSGMKDRLGLDHPSKEDIYSDTGGNTSNETRPLRIPIERARRAGKLLPKISVDDRETGRKTIRNRY